ncbi:MAG: hypothetical protein S4CHLAM45_08950 [Chlamydiales bacterium]|nr:hypothetical protein [Chlamydiales bacterium]MCH9620553.1 hypothetical protein [Chlamydiales bacterium]MCH9622999.1 hypothetical protein [Chlamydiales bacterium]
MIPLPIIESDEEGVFFRTDNVNIFEQCYGCGLPTIAGICFNRSCPLSPFNA